MAGLRRTLLGLCALGLGPLAAPAAALPTTSLWISEVMANPSGADDGREWVELFNAGSAPIDLSSWSLGWGTTDYTAGVLQLSGVVLPGRYFVVGGPTSDAGNGNPVYDQAVDFAPDLPNPFLVSSGVALFDVPASALTASSVPVHAVVYGGLFGNVFGLVDETGAAATATAAAPAGQSLAYDGAGGWSVSAAPTPGTGVLASVSEPGASLLLLALLPLVRRRERRPLRG